MKLTVYIKDPDGFSEAVRIAAEKFAKDIPGIDADERESIRERREEKLFDAMERWVEFNECVTIEFDTEAGTAVVVPK